MRWAVPIALIVLLTALGCPPTPPGDDDDANSTGSGACVSDVPGFPEYCVEVESADDCPSTDETKSFHDDDGCPDLGYTDHCPSGVWVESGGSCL